MRLSSHKHHHRNSPQLFIAIKNKQTEMVPKIGTIQQLSLTSPLTKYHRNICLSASTLYCDYSNILDPRIEQSVNRAGQPRDSSLSLHQIGF